MDPTASFTQRIAHLNEFSSLIKQLQGGDISERRSDTQIFIHDIFSELKIFFERTYTIHTDFLGLKSFSQKIAMGFTQLFKNSSTCLNSRLLDVVFQAIGIVRNRPSVEVHVHKKKRKSQSREVDKKKEKKPSLKERIARLLPGIFGGVLVVLGLQEAQRGSELSRDSACAFLRACRSYSHYPDPSVIIRPEDAFWELSDRLKTLARFIDAPFLNENLTETFAQDVLNRLNPVINRLDEAKEAMKRIGNERQLAGRAAVLTGMSLIAYQFVPESVKVAIKGVGVVASIIAVWKGRLLPLESSRDIQTIQAIRQNLESLHQWARNEDVKNQFNALLKKVIQRRKEEISNPERIIPSSQFKGERQAVHA